MAAHQSNNTQHAPPSPTQPSQPPLLTGLGSKYARTLFNQAKEAKAELQVREDLSKFSLYVKNDRAIMTELMNPIKTEAEKIAHVNKSLTAAAGKPHAVTVAFLAEMQSKKRLDLLHKIKVVKSF
jgi:F0F1-type ATP synthase delta subunit